MLGSYLGQPAGRLSKEACVYAVTGSDLAMFIRQSDDGERPAQMSVQSERRLCRERVLGFKTDGR